MVMMGRLPPLLQVQWLFASSHQRGLTLAEHLPCYLHFHDPPMQLRTCCLGDQSFV